MAYKGFKGRTTLPISFALKEQYFPLYDAIYTKTRVYTHQNIFILGLKKAAEIEGIKVELPDR